MVGGGESSVKGNACLATILIAVSLDNFSCPETINIFMKAVYSKLILQSTNFE